MDVFTLVVFFLASVILLIGFLGQIIFKKTNIPDILWLLLFGILLSFLITPSQKELLTHFAGPFGTLALVIILFNSGMEFDLAKFSEGVPRGILLTIVAFFLSVGVTAGVMCFFLGWPPLYGLLLGVAVGGTSSGVIIPIITRLKVSDFLKSVLTVESIATDILVIIFAISLIDLIATGTTNPFDALKNIIAAFSIGTSIGLIGALLWLFFLVKVEREIRSYLLDFTVVLLLYVFTEFIGGSGAIAALTFGLILGNTGSVRKVIKIPEQVKLSRGEKMFYDELNFFVRTFFFVYLGLMFSFSSLKLLMVGLLLVILFVIERVLAVYISLYKSGLQDSEKNIASVLFGRGLSAAVVSQMPLVMLAPIVKDPNQLLILTEFSPVVLSVVLFSIIGTVLGVSYFTKKARVAVSK